MNGTTTIKKQNKLSMPLVQVRQKAQITLPQKARRALGIQEGDYLQVKLENNSLVLSPKTMIDKLPFVDLSPAGEKMLKETLNDVEKGINLRTYDNVDDLIKNLHQKSMQANSKKKR